MVVLNVLPHSTLLLLLLLLLLSSTSTSPTQKPPDLFLESSSPGGTFSAAVVEELVEPHRRGASGWRLSRLALPLCHDTDTNIGMKPCHHDKHGTLGILTIDDDQVNIMVMESLLGPLGFRVGLSSHPKVVL